MIMMMIVCAATSSMIRVMCHLRICDGGMSTRFRMYRVHGVHGVHGRQRCRCMRRRIRCHRALFVMMYAIHIDGDIGLLLLQCVWTFAMYTLVKLGIVHGGHWIKIWRLIAIARVDIRIGGGGGRIILRCRCWLECTHLMIPIHASRGTMGDDIRRLCVWLRRMMMALLRMRLVVVLLLLVIVGRGRCRSHSMTSLCPRSTMNGRLRRWHRDTLTMGYSMLLHMWIGRR
mmetsp:Transcript_52942/g.87714  ORF Transcript_52942/g.87714 Transcript_52942/m.87714 type:complete len:229 (-) Transcript_52942:705-1391(-)